MLEIGYDKADNDTRIQEIHQHNGKLTESLNLAQLPGGMQYVYLNSDQLTGEIYLTQLQKGVKTLNFSHSWICTQLGDRYSRR